MITNISIRSKFNDIGSIETMIAKKCLLFLGEIIRIPCKCIRKNIKMFKHNKPLSCIPARLVNAFLKIKRPIEDLI